MSGNSSDFGGNIAKDYDEGLGPIIFVDYAAEMARRVAAGPTNLVLETACGTGIVTHALRDALPATANLVATDLNPGMMAIAQSRLQPSKEVIFQTADGTALPFPDASFDTVVCQFGMMFYPDKDKGYREAYRVLGPRGRYLFSVWDSHGYNAFGRITHQVVEHFFPTDTPTFYKVPFGYQSIDLIKDQLIAAGFTDIIASVLIHEKTIPNMQDFTRGVVFGNPLLFQIQQRGGDAAKIQAAITLAMEKEFGHPAKMKLQAIIFEAKKK